jgi:hypothetical protein
MEPAMTTQEWLSLFGAVAFVYFATIVIKALWRLKQGNNRSARVLLLKKLLALADLVSEGNTEPEELKSLAEAVLEDELIPRLRRSLEQN